MKAGSDEAGPNTVVRPPLLYGLGTVIGLGLDSVLPLPFSFGVDDSVRYVTAAAIGVAALSLAATAFLQFRRAGTNVPTWQPSLALVTDGLYAHSRNPIYIALNLLYLSIAVATGSSWMLALLLPALLVLQFGVILREEAYLEEKFGQSYRDYKQKVRRWL